VSSTNLLLFFVVYCCRHNFYLEESVMKAVCERLAGFQLKETRNGKQHVVEPLVGFSEFLSELRRKPDGSFCELLHDNDNMFRLI
jgi:hypothetical protein